MIPSVTEKRYWAKICKTKKICSAAIVIWKIITFLLYRYLPTYGMTENARRDSQQFLRDCGAKAELGMLAVQLGTEETNYERPFTLNLLSNVDEENVNNANREIDAEGNNAKRSNAENGKPKQNEDYKAKLDTVYADFFEDEHEGLKRSMDLLDLLDEIE